MEQTEAEQRTIACFQIKKIWGGYFRLKKKKKKKLQYLVPFFKYY